MKTKAARKAPRAKPQASAPQPQDPGETLVAASAQALGLAIDPAWADNVKFNLNLILRHAALVDEFPLPDDAEPAPIFHA